MNKVIKSMVAIVLAVTMMFSGAVSAFAAETANVVLATNKEKYAIGETVEVTVSSDVKFNTYEAYFQYDKEALKFDTIVGTSTYNEDMATNANAEDVFGGGVVFTVYFTAQKAGEYTVALDESASYFSYGIDITDYDVTYTTATVVVEGKEEPAPHEHIEEIIPAVPATCSATGLTEGKKCSVCDEVIVAQKEIAKLAHTEEEEGQWTVEGAPTCTKGGVKTWACVDCGALVRSEFVDPLGHTEVTVAGKEATCNETGLTDGKKCTVCGVITVEQKVVPAKGHKDAETKEVVTKEATCCEAGSKNIICVVCDTVIGTEKIAATGEHTYGEGCVAVKPHEHVWTDIEAKAATCTEAGYSAHKACECGETEGKEVIDALGHKGGEATCTDKAKCEVCGESYGELVAHNYVDGKCECGDTLEAIEIAGTTYWMNEAGNLYAGNTVVGKVDGNKATINGTNYEKDANGVWVEKVEEKPAVSTKKYYTVKVEAGLNGKISPEGSFEVREGKDKTFKITANEGFVIDVLTVDRKEVSKAAGKETYTLTLEDIDENYNIKVTFVKEVAPVVDDKANPSTGSNEFVGAAVALAVVSVMGAAVISKK